MTRFRGDPLRFNQPPPEPWRLTTANKTNMDLNLPETPREITRAKIALFRHQAEYIHAKDEATSAEREWLVFAANRISELESEPV